MIILPAIDLLDGQVVRLREGKLADKTVYSTILWVLPEDGRRKVETACMS